jgi:hypothetical protein
MKLDALSWRYLLHKILDGEQKKKDGSTEPLNLSLADLRKNRRSNIISPVARLSWSLNPQSIIYSSSSSFISSVPSWSYHSSAEWFFSI